MDFIQGTGVALVTPFDTQLTIDYSSLRNVLEHVEDGQIDYLVALGTTSEAPTLSKEEKDELVAFIQDHSSKPLVIGYGGNNTRELIAGVSAFKETKAKALLSVTPYYNRPSQEGLFQHFRQLADHSPLPLILYNVPFRTGVNLEAETTLRLAEHQNIIAIKEASGDLDQVKKIASSCPSDFMVLSGDDACTLDMIVNGAKGVISVIANYKPAEFREMVSKALVGDVKSAQTLNEALRQDYEWMVAEGNPTSVKTAMEAIGLIRRNVRLPLVSGSEQLLKNFT